MKKKIVSLLTVYGVYTLLALLLFWPLVFQPNTLLAPDSLIPHASTLALDKLRAETGTSRSRAPIGSTTEARAAAKYESRVNVILNQRTKRVGA